MPKRKEPELDPKEQFKRFVETAKEHGVDSEKAEQRFGRLSKPPEEILEKIVSKKNTSG